MIRGGVSLPRRAAPLEKLGVRWTSSFSQMFVGSNYYNEYWDRGKKAQYDGGEDITDKDRYRELYFDWAEPTMRGVHANRFGDVGMERRRYKQLGYGEQLEFQRIMRSICQGNYLNLTEEQMRAGCLGYMSEDDDELTREHDEFGVSFTNASIVYKSEALADQCEGRPTYEWQIPAGVDRYYGYKTVSTVVDVNYTDAINENDVYDWELTDEQVIKGKHYILKNRSTNAKIVVCHIFDTRDVIDKTPDIDTCAIMASADLLLSSVDNIFSPRSKNDFDLMQLCLGWNFLAWYGHWQFLPCYFAISALQIFRTFLIPNQGRYKLLFKTCREKELHVVLADWLTPDWIERELHTSDYDIAAICEKNNMFGVGNTSMRGDFIVEASWLKAQFLKWKVQAELRGFYNTRWSKFKNAEEVEKAEYPQTYCEAVQNKRLDIVSHTVNNMESESSVIGVKATQDMSAECVMEMVVKRMTGEIEVGVPISYHDDHDRVSVAFDL